MPTSQTFQLLPQLVVFVSVVELGTFKAAAEALGKSPSSVTREIATLEQALGVPLLSRSSRQRVVPTEAGYAIYRQSRSLVQVVHSVQGIAADSRGALNGVITIAGTAALVRWVVQPCLAEFLNAHPSIQIQMRVVRASAVSEQATADILVLPHGRQIPGVPLTPLLPVRYVLCATPHYLDQMGRPARPADLVAHNCLFFSEDPNADEWRFNRGGSIENVLVNSRYAVSDNSLIFQAMLDHVGIACLPDFALHRALATGLVVPVLPEWELSTSYSGDASICHPASAVPERVLRLTDHLLKAIAHPDHPRFGQRHPAY